MDRLSNTPNHVPSKEYPDTTVENIPQEVLEKAISSCKYVECPHCEERQWFYFTPGVSVTVECESCDDDVKLIG
jgi:hypothetical protein